MNLTLFIALLFGLQGLYWLIGKKSARNLQTNEDYFLAGKTVRFFPLMMTFLATQVGGGLVLGAANEAYQFGLYVLFYPLGVAMGLILLGLGMGRKLAAFNVSTVAEILEVVYKSSLLRKIASLLSILSLFMVLVAQIIASKQFLLSIGFDNTPLFILFWAIVILYTAQGGLKAVISTDLVQATYFSLIFFACIALVLFSGYAIDWPAIPTLESASPKFCGWLLMPLLFMLIEQDMGQRCFAGGSPRIVSLATLWAGVFTFAICSIPIFFGVLARSLNLEIPTGSSVLMCVIEKTTNPGMAAFVGCAILAAIISTATSLINAISSNLSSDFKIPFAAKNPVLVSQWTTGILCLIAILFSFYFDQIVDVMIQSYELSVSCLFIPISIALFKRQGNFLSALLSILAGALSFALLRIYPSDFPKELISIFSSFLGFGLGELIVRNRKKRFVTAE